MISNGYLFDADRVQRAKDLWQLKRVQITLDGTAQTYNRVKDYVYRDVNAFERVLQNIGLLTGTGIHTRIRLNVSKHNIGEMAELVELLHQRFGADEHLTVTSSALFEEEHNAELFAQRMQLEQQITACGFARKLYDLPKDTAKSAMKPSSASSRSIGPTSRPVLPVSTIPSAYAS